MPGWSDAHGPTAARRTAERPVGDDGVRTTYSKGSRPISRSEKPHALRAPLAAALNARPDGVGPGVASEESKGSRPISRVLSTTGSLRQRSRDNHSSTTTITRRLQQPTRRARGPRVAAPCGAASLPIWPCSMWGLPCRFIAELAVRSYRTISPLPDPDRSGHRRYLSVALSVGLRRPAVSWHIVLRSPDFPPPP